MPVSIDFAAPFDVQIAQARAQHVKLADAYYSLPPEKRAQAFTVSNLAALDQVQAVADKLAAAQAEGKTLAEFKKWAVTQDWALPAHRLETIYRNSVQTAYMAGHWRSFEENQKQRPYLMLDAINDSRTRPSHLALDGVIKPVGDEFWDTHSPPMGHRCLLPGMRIKGDFKLGSKSAYSGPAVEIETATGKWLSVTVNHPILTSNGWVAAGELKEGARLLCDSSGTDWVAAWGINNEQLPPTVEDVFKALAAQAFGVVARSSFDLHGDAKLGKGDIYVAGSDCELMHGIKSNSSHFLNDWKFILTGNSRQPAGSLNTSGNSIPVTVSSKFIDQPFGIRSGLSSCIRYFKQTEACNLVKVLYFGLKSVVEAISSFPRSSALALDSSPVVLHGSPFNGLCLTGIPWGNTIAQKKTAYCTPAYAESIGQRLFAFTADVVRDQLFGVIGLPLPGHTRLARPDGVSLLARSTLHASLAQQTAEKAVTDVRLFEQLHSGYPCNVSGDEIVSIRYFTFSGHVYDFQTDQGWMFAQGLIISNCRCSVRSLSPKQAMEKGGVTQAVPAEGGPDEGWGSDPREWSQTLGRLVRESMDSCRIDPSATFAKKHIGAKMQCLPDGMAQLFKAMAAEHQVTPMPAPKTVSRDLLIDPSHFKQDALERMFDKSYDADKVALWANKVGIVIAPDKSLFLKQSGDWKITKNQRAHYMLLFADALADPTTVQWIEGDTNAPDTLSIFGQFLIGKEIHCVVISYKWNGKTWEGWTAYKLRPILWDEYSSEGVPIWRRQ